MSGFFPSASEYWISRPFFAGKAHFRFVCEMCSQLLGVASNRGVQMRRDCWLRRLSSREMTPTSPFVFRYRTTSVDIRHSMDMTRKGLTPATRNKQPLRRCILPVSIHCCQTIFVFSQKSSTA